MSNFEFDGEKYKQASKHQKEWGNKLIAALKLKGDEAVLDLGCGDGVLTAQLSELVPNGKVLGIDASAGMINAAKKVEKQNLAFTQTDINNLNFTNEFDVIFSNAALHWVKNHNLLLKNCLAALKPNGIIQWNFAGDGNCANFYGAVKTVMTDSAHKEHFHNFEWPWFMPSADEYKRLIANAGFREINIESENADRYFANQDEMIKWIDQPSIVPFLTVLPAQQKKNFRDAVVELMIQKTQQSGGRCFETFRRINVTARK